MITLNIFHTFFYVSIGYYEEAIVCWVSSFFSIFPYDGEDLPQKILFSYHCITYFAVLRMLRSSRSYLFYKRSALRNIAKKTTSVFLNKVRLATLIKKKIAVTVFSCAFFEIIKGTFFMKHLWRLLRRLEKSPWLLVEDIIFSALWVFSFWLIAFSWTLPLNVGILSSNFLLKSGGTH